MCCVVDMPTASRSTTDLEHGNKVDIISVDHLLNELDQLLLESLVGLQPGGVEVQTEGSPAG